MSPRPNLVQFGDLLAEHFREHPIWVACHSADYDEAWYDETDEETFRAVIDGQPVNASNGMYLVAAEVTLADGARLDGFVTPAMPSDASMGTWQPHVFVDDGGTLGFWTGMAGLDAMELAAAYASLGRTSAAVFPARFRARSGLTQSVAEGQILGFYQLKSFTEPPIVIR
ncbi:MAG: hypothetical protein V4813_14935 [Gemmatimonadota bacterium]